MKKFAAFSLVLFIGASSTLKPASGICYGTTADGRLEGGVKLPGAGANYVSYSGLAGFLGRTYVHSTVKEIVVAAYKQLETGMPGKVYKYAETGFERGGRFRPHKTHRNGLSVDFMVPVLNEKGESVHLPTHLFNKFGYAIEFDAQGKYGSYRLDYTAMAAHIAALHQAAVSQGVDIWRVIFDPALQPYLMDTKYGDYLKKHIEFSKKKSWVRHDEHYHVDFKVPCIALKGE